MSIPRRAANATARTATPDHEHAHEHAHETPVRRLLSPRWAVLAVALLAVLVYANSAGNGFALDDGPIIVENERAHGIDQVATALTTPYWPGSTSHVALYRPLTVATYAIGWDLWHGDPRGFHAVNVLLHAGVTVVLLLLLLRLGFPLIAATAGAAVFAVHPVHTEAVANVVGRAELLAALFFLAACWIYMRRDLPRLPRAAAIAVCYFLALASKEIAVTLPAALILLELGSPRGDGESSPLRRLWRERAVCLGAAVAAAVYGAVRLDVLGVAIGNDAASFLQERSTGEQLAMALRAWPEYARLLIFPRDLVADYSPAVILAGHGLGPMNALGLALAAAGLLLAAAAWRRQRSLAIAILWFFITIFPVSNLVVPIGVLLAERTLYLPSVAVALAAAAATVWTTRASPAERRVFAVLGIAVLGLGAFRSWQRNPVWASTDAVIQDLVQKHPESFRAQWAVGSKLLERGRVEDGFRLYEQALALVPEHYRLLAEYGVRLMEHGRPREAEAVLRRATALFPMYATNYVFTAQSLMRQHDHDGAIRVLAEGLAHASERGPLYHQLSLAYTAVGNLTAATTAIETSIALSGGESWLQWFLLCDLRLRRGEVEAARVALARARSFATDRPDAVALLDQMSAAVMSASR